MRVKPVMQRMEKSLRMGKLPVTKMGRSMTMNKVFCQQSPCLSKDCILASFLVRHEYLLTWDIVYVPMVKVEH